MRVLLLGSVRGGAELAIEPHVELVEVESAASALAHVEGGSCDVMVVGESPWSWTFASSLLDEQRPACLAMCQTMKCERFVPDDCCCADASAAEKSVRLRLAIERARTRRRLARRAMVDPLTRLPNRRAALVGLTRAAARARRQRGSLSLVLIDLDHFKQVNESHGHDAGDRLLRRVGNVLARSTRGDEVCARIGGDEFAIIVTGRLADAQMAGRRMQAALQREGVLASVASCELAPGEELRALYRRTDSQLKMRKVERDERRHSGLMKATA